jgi:glutamyl-tRNA synthetase/glutamyl-Q tRNA(Asp) synthetase
VIRPDLDAARRHFVPPPVTRFAPSPTGYLHLGHVVNAIYVWGVAQALDGEVVVRLEDHDRIRSRPRFAGALLEDLAWLGFIDARTPIVRQQDRHELYADALERLRGVARVYACDCSRTSFAGERYPGHCRTRGLAETAGRTLRVELQTSVERADDLLLGALRQTPAEQCGDLVVRDRDGHWTYQFAVTVDDLYQRVTLVVRGEDLLPSTGRQVQLGRLLRRAGVGDAAWPPRYLHHPLILDEAGVKLSKSTGASGVRDLRTAGVSPDEVIGRAASAIGLLDAARPVAASDAAQLLGSDAGPLPVAPDRPA